MVSATNIALGMAAGLYVSAMAVIASTDFRTERTGRWWAIIGFTVLALHLVTVLLRAPDAPVLGSLLLASLLISYGYRSLRKEVEDGG